MRNEINDGKMTVYFEGELNSSNAEAIEEELENILKKNKFDSLVFDFDKLNYISSAGLRIIVRVKKNHDDLSLINLSEDVYKIFEMVGFNSYLTISKK